MRRITSLLIICCITTIASAQQVVSTVKNLVWADSLKTFQFSDYRDHSTYYFSGASYDETKFDFLPYYYEAVKLPFDGSFTVVLTDVTYSPLNDDRGRRTFAETPSQKIQSAPTVITAKGYQLTKPYAQISILPFRKNPSTGTLEKVVSFRYNISITPSAPSTIRGNSYAAHSILATGTWYKIGVTKDGLYKLDKTFLQNLGIDVASLDPRNIRIYGNGGGMLPEANAVFRYDDLQEDAIKVSGEGDGKFDDGDFVLFYGQGPHRWVLNATGTCAKFDHILHLYSDTTFYFVNVDLGTGKRVADVSSSGQSPTILISTFDDYAFHELEQQNFLTSGRAWFGEDFEFETSKSFPFSFPSLVTSSPVAVTIAFMGKSIYAANTITSSSGGQTITTGNVAKICAEYTCPFGSEVKTCGTFTPSSSSFTIDLNYTKGAADAQGWLNYIEVNVQRALTWSGSQNNFRSIASMGAGNISQFTLSNANSSLLVWDVTNPINPQNQLGALNGTQFQFTAATDTLREYVMFANTEGYTPAAVGKIDNQDLHGMGEYSLFIISPDILLQQAQELADYHKSHDGISSVVVSENKIFNEFSSGTPDVSSIRDFLRMFYKRANGDSSLMPKYLLLYGDGSYDNKGNIPGNKSLILTWESASSVNPTSSFVADDFFACLDDNEGGNIADGTNFLDVGVGRLTINDATEAEAVNNKIKVYTSPQSFGNWRNVITFVGDDQDNDVHVSGADVIATSTASGYPVYNIDKIYLDAYQQISFPGGDRYPDVNTAIDNRICKGSLIMNYTGHGGIGGWAHERVLGIPQIQGYTNLYKLPLFVTATCEFSQYDNPPVVSAGEDLLLNPNGGAIALVSTVRLVYSNANQTLNVSFMGTVLNPDPNGIIAPLGEILRRSKNAVPGDVNNRKFTLIGDPAITVAYPTYNVNTTSINHHNIGEADTLKALQKVTVAGTVNDLSGNVMTNFNGVIYPTVYDKAVTYQTLANDGDSYVKNFVLQKNVIYNGKASVKNGNFTFSFIVPKDISYQYGFGKLSYYADNGVIDAHGYKNDIIVGGISDTSKVDVLGPTVKVYMNDDKFVSGGITDANPTILVKISDSSGVNTVGTGIGHDVAGVLDNDTKNTLVMNNFYTSDLDSYTSGEVRYPLHDLTEGLHSVSVKAWDVYDNSAEGMTDFIVSESAQMALAHVLNYPNPFTTRTEFMFEHNMPNNMITVMIQIYTVSGKLIKTIQQAVMPQAFAASGATCDCNLSTGGGGYRVNGIYWDGKDDYGDNIGKGVYVYKLSVKTDNGMKADTYQKLVILK
ncbi:MAG TPA: type IX secretion system sortase PorU [Chitinophagales bacterium]|nr:type IX secretion system sortase PorU [Chitinophagales bacterium]